MLLVSKEHTYIDIKFSWHDTFLEVFGSKKTKGPKQDSHIRLRSPMVQEGEP